MERRGPGNLEFFWAPNGSRLTARCHFTGPKKLSISRVQLPPTCPSNECCPHKKHFTRGRINYRCINRFYCCVIGFTPPPLPSASEGRLYSLHTFRNKYWESEKVLERQCSVSWGEEGEVGPNEMTAKKAWASPLYYSLYGRIIYCQGKTESILTKQILVKCSYKTSSCVFYCEYKYLDFIVHWKSSFRLQLLKKLDDHNTELENTSSLFSIHFC